MLTIPQPGDTQRSYPLRTLNPQTLHFLRTAYTPGEVEAAILYHDGFDLRDARISQYGDSEYLEEIIQILYPTEDLDGMDPATRTVCSWLFCESMDVSEQARRALRDADAESERPSILRAYAEVAAPTHLREGGQTDSGDPRVRAYAQEILAAIPIADYGEIVDYADNHHLD